MLFDIGEQFYSSFRHVVSHSVDSRQEDYSSGTVTKSLVQIFSGNPSTSTGTFIHLMLWDARYLKPAMLFILLQTTDMFPS